MYVRSMSIHRSCAADGWSNYSPVSLADENIRNNQLYICFEPSAATVAYETVCPYMLCRYLHKLMYALNDQYYIIFYISKLLTSFQIVLYVNGGGGGIAKGMLKGNTSKH